MPERAVSEQRVKEIIAEVYGRSPEGRPLAPGEIGSDLPLYSEDAAEASLGLDSLDALEVATELEQEYDLVLPAEVDPADLRTVRQLVSYLERLLREQHGPP